MPRVTKKRFYIMLPEPYTANPQPVLGAIWADEAGGLHKSEIRIIEGALCYDDWVKCQDLPISLVEEMAEIAERRGYMLTMPLGNN